MDSMLTDLQGGEGEGGEGWEGMGKMAEQHNDSFSDRLACKPSLPTPASSSRLISFAVQVRGAGDSGDSYHITKPPPDASGAVRCMQAALTHVRPDLRAGGKEAGIPSQDEGSIRLSSAATPCLRYPLFCDLLLEGRRPDGGMGEGYGRRTIPPKFSRIPLKPPHMMREVPFVACMRH